MSKSAKEVLVEAGYPASVIDAFSAYDLKKYAKKADPKWEQPPAEGMNIELKSHTPEKGKNNGKQGMYLSISVEGAFGGIFTRLNDGDELNADGKVLLVKLLSSVATNAAALIEEISQ